MSVKTTKETCNQDITFKRNAYVEGSFIVPTFYDIYGNIDGEIYSLGDYLDSMTTPKLPFSLTDNGTPVYRLYSEYDNVTENTNYVFDIPYSLISIKDLYYATRLIGYTDPNDAISNADAIAALSCAIPQNTFTLQGIKKENDSYKAITLSLAPYNYLITNEIENKIFYIQLEREIRKLAFTKGSTNVFTYTGKWSSIPYRIDNNLNTLIIVASNGSTTYQASVNIPIRGSMSEGTSISQYHISTYKPGVTIVPMAYGSTSDDIGNVRVEFTDYGKDTDYIKIDLDQCAFASDFQFKFYLKG